MLIFLSTFMKMDALLHIYLHHLCFWYAKNRRGFWISWDWGYRQLWAVTWILGINLCPLDEPLVFIREPSLSPLFPSTLCKNEQPKTHKNTHSFFVGFFFFFLPWGQIFFFLSTWVLPFSNFSHEKFSWIFICGFINVRSPRVIKTVS